MAVRFDATGDGLVRTANLPSRTAFSAMGWFKITTDRNAYSTFIALDENADGALCQTATNGTTLALFTESDATEGSALTVGTWYHITLTCGATYLRVYLNGTQDIQVAQWTFTPTAGLYIGNDSIDEYLNGCAAYVKCWSAELTVAEIQQEMYTVMPRRFLNLYSWTPLLPGANERIRDYGGLGYGWTAGGTLADEDGPPISWGSPALISQYVAALANPWYSFAQM